MLSWYINPVELARILREVTGSGKYEMVASNPEI